MAEERRSYIVYACPQGELAEQLGQYFAASRELVGPNSAHHYPPHCTLTGFFHDAPAAVCGYVAALAEAHRRAARSCAAVRVRGIELTPQFHGLLLDGVPAREIAAIFAASAASPTRQDAIRLKDWLHLSLAYDFAPEQHHALAGLARVLVDPLAPARWELRLYERHPGHLWTCHASWPLW